MEENKEFDQPSRQKEAFVGRSTDLVDVYNFVQFSTKKLQERLELLEEQDTNRKMGPKEKEDLKNYALTTKWLRDYLGDPVHNLDISEAITSVNRSEDADALRPVSGMMVNFATLWRSTDKLDSEVREHLERHRNSQLSRFKRMDEQAKTEVLSDQEKLIQVVLEEGESIIHTSFAFMKNGKLELLGTIATPHNQNIQKLSNQQKVELYGHPNDIMLPKESGDLRVFDQVSFAYQYQYEEGNLPPLDSKFTTVLKNGEPVVEIRYHLSEEGIRFNQTPDGRKIDYAYLLKVPKKVAEQIASLTLKDPMFIRHLVTRTVLDEKKGIQANLGSVLKDTSRGDDVRFATREDVFGEDGKRRLKYYGEGIPPFETPEWQASRTYIHVQGLEGVSNSRDGIKIPILNSKEVGLRDKIKPNLKQVIQCLERTGQMG